MTVPSARCSISALVSFTPVSARAFIHGQAHFGRNACPASECWAVPPRVRDFSLPLLGKVVLVMRSSPAWRRRAGEDIRGVPDVRNVRSHSSVPGFGWCAHILQWYSKIMRQPKLFTTLKTYDRSQFVVDLAAGATVAMVAIPLSLANRDCIGR